MLDPAREVLRTLWQWAWVSWIIVPVAYLAFNRYGRGLTSIPGPFLGSLTSGWKFYWIWREEWPWLNVDLHARYGPLVRIGPSHISAASLESLSVVHSQKKSFRKTVMYEILQPHWQGDALHNVFSVQDQTQHAALKRAIGSLYTTSAVLEYEPNLDKSLVLFIARLKEVTKAAPGPVDMSAWLQFWAFDALGEVNFSRPMGFLEAGKDVDGICELDHEMMLYFAKWGQIPAIEKIYARLSTWTRVLKPNPLFTFTLDIVKDRLEKPNACRDMLNSFIRVHQKDPERLGLREVHGAAYINVVTAHDVVAILLRAVLYHLDKNPPCYDRLVSEIRTAVARGTLSQPAKLTELSDMSYLSAVINESLRIHPSTGTMFERYVPEGGVVLHGKFIPAGTTIGVNAWVMNRNKEVFGDDVESFRPERWIDSSPEQLSTMRRCMATWGAGSRSCIGKNLAMMQISKVITELYRHFDIHLVDRQKDWHVSGGWLTRQTQMDMLLTPVGIQQGQDHLLKIP